MGDLEHSFSACFSQVVPKITMTYPRHGHDKYEPPVLEIFNRHHLSYAYTPSLVGYVKFI